MARTVNPEARARQRDRILTAAAQEFATRGYEGTSTASICRRAGIGSGTLFHYFPGKQDIVRALFARDLPVVRDVLGRARAAPEPETGVDLVLDHLLAEVSHPQSSGLAATAVLRAAADEELAGILRELDDAVQQGLTELLERLEAGEPGRLRFPAQATAHWIRALVDSAHLGLVDGRRQQTMVELEQLAGWLLGQQGT